MQGMLAEHLIAPAAFSVWALFGALSTQAVAPPC